MRPLRLPLLLVALLATACATTSAQAPAAAAAVAQPPAFLWEVTRPGAPDKPLYLTGSIHLGLPGQFTFPPSLEAALARSQALVVELDPDKAQANAKETQKLVLRLGTYAPPDGLQAHLSEETRSRLPELLAKVGLPPAAVERMRPWLLYITLSVLELQRAGYSEAGGIDRLLLAKARDTKRIVELETMEGQLGMLASLPDPVQELMLREMIEQSPLTAVNMARMTTAWEGGNPSALAELLFTQAEDPAFQPFYEALFYTRNRRMADQVAGMVDAPETHFVVVGAGHLVGPEGLLALLERAGFQVRQLPREP
ncbi:TraB/GumN family protein [Cystobacter fuscus]|uniref:TraB/GumN family protein n=1 Tax=Cystobacter fuscus TaxID=43 RepID=UPI002B31D8C6|nr:TraB/GumN family protein [Cystobacter fuscus]